MKLKSITRVSPKDNGFFNDDRLFKVYKPKRMNVWTVHKRFGSKAEYRILSDVKTDVAAAQVTKVIHAAILRIRAPVGIII